MAWIHLLGLAMMACSQARGTGMSPSLERVPSSELAQRELQDVQCVSTLFCTGINEPCRDHAFGS